MLRFQAAGTRLCRAMATQAAGRERATTLTATKPESLLPALASKLAAWTAEQPPHILLFSLSKHLPRAVLSEAVNMLHQSDVRAHARVGFLSSSLPASVAYDHAAGMEHLHAISLASIPETRGVAFRSTIPGAARVSVGRWPNQKETWNKGTEMRSDRLDQSGGRDWRGLWGKENVDLRLPDQLNELEYVLKLIQSFQCTCTSFCDRCPSARPSRGPRRALFAGQSLGHERDVDAVRDRARAYPLLRRAAARAYDSRLGGCRRCTLRRGILVDRAHF